MIGNYYNPRQYMTTDYSAFNPQYTQAQQAIHTGALNSLKNDYNQTVQNTVNNLNKRGMFGSSIASEDIGKANYNMAQSEATLAAEQAKQQQQNLLEQQKLQQNQAQFQQQMAYYKQQQDYQRQLQQQQQKQTRINANRQAGLPDWWGAN